MPARVRRHPLGGWCDPSAAFTAMFADERYAFWLDAGAGAVLGRSWMGAATGPTVTASVRDSTITIRDRDGRSQTRAGDVLDFLRGELASTERHSRTAASGDAHAGFRLGWVGWLGYALGEQTTGTALPSAETPDAALLFCGRALEFDHETRTMSVLVFADDPGGSAWVEEVRGVLTDAVLPVPGPAPVGALAEWRHSAAEYESLIRRCQASIARGDAYQLCLTNTITVAGCFAPVDTYLRLRATSPTHHGGLVRFGETSLASASPEQFLSITTGGRILTRPIKGTRPRGATLVRDIELRAELEASDKEQAENLMIVDLMRNDLGRVAALGSVAVTSLLAVESYAHVHQLVSSIEADLAPGLSSLDALAASFPAGSMTGAPKIRAMRILAQLEQGPRGIYAGAFGYVGVDGAIDLAMVIRSIVITPEEATIGTGGGITALSVPAEEVDETRVKARALLAALGVALEGSAEHPGV